jgi:hypothetical protein
MQLWRCGPVDSSANWAALTLLPVPFAVSHRQLRCIHTATHEYSRVDDYENRKAERPAPAHLLRARRFILRREFRSPK